MHKITPPCVIHLFQNVSVYTKPIDQYVSVQYAGLTDIVDYVYGECYPYQLGADLAQQAVFCRSVTCYSNP